MLKLNEDDLKRIEERLSEIPGISSEMLKGFACSASDTSCGCGWDCSSTKT